MVLSRGQTLRSTPIFRSTGVRAINLDDGDSIVTAKIIIPDVKWLFIVTKKGQCIRFQSR